MPTDFILYTLHFCKPEKQNQNMDAKNTQNPSGGHYTGTGTKSDLDNHSNQCNPNHGEHKGYTSGYQGTGTKSDLDNHGNQLNPNNDASQGKK